MPAKFPSSYDRRIPAQWKNAAEWAMGYDVNDAVDTMRAIAGDVQRWMDSDYGDDVRRFASNWRWVRMLISLQVRLIIEQILWDRGGDWRKMITGFLPMSSESEASPSEGDERRERSLERASERENKRLREESRKRFLERQRRVREP